MRRGAAIVGALAMAALFWWLLGPQRVTTADLGGDSDPQLQTPAPVTTPAPPSEQSAPRPAFPPGASTAAFRARLLRVQVVRNSDGGPVVGATIRVFRPHLDAEIASLVTDESGRAVTSLRDRLGGDDGYARHHSASLGLDLLVTAPGLGSMPVRNSDYLPGEWWEVRLPDPVLVSGVVRDDRGRLVVGARIRSGPEESDYAAADGGRIGMGPSAITGIDGRYDLALGPGMWAVQAAAHGHAIGTETLRIGRAATNCDLVLRICPAISLRVVDAANAGVPGATVVYRHRSTSGWMAPPSHDGVTDASGRHTVPAQWADSLEDTIGLAMAFDGRGGLYRGYIHGAGESTLWPLGHANDSWGSDWSAWEPDARFLSGTVDWGPGPPPDHIEFGTGQTQTQFDEMVEQQQADERRRGMTELTQWGSMQASEQVRARDGVAGNLWSQQDSATRVRLIWFDRGETRILVRGVGPGPRIRFAATKISDASVHRDVHFVATEVPPDTEHLPEEVRAMLVWDRDGRPAEGIVSTLGRGGVSDAAGSLAVRVQTWAASRQLLPSRWTTAAPPSGGWPGVVSGQGPVDLGTLRLLAREHLTLTLINAAGEPLPEGEWELSVGPPTGETAYDWRNIGGKRVYVPPTRLMAYSRATGSLPDPPSCWTPDAPGTVKLTVTVPGHNPWTRTWPWLGLPADRRVLVSLERPPAQSPPWTPEPPNKLIATLRGSVIDGTGAPLAGVRVGRGWGGGARMSIVESPWGFHYTDAAGTLVFPLAELDAVKKLEVPISKPGFVGRTVHVQPLPGNAAYPPVRIFLERSHRLVVWLPGNVAPDQFEWQAKGEVEARGVDGVAATYRVPEADGSDGRPWWEQWNAGDRHARVGDRWRIEISDLVPGTYEVTASKIPGVDTEPVRVRIVRGQDAEVTIPAGGK